VPKNLSGEVWREIKNTNGNYQISNFGRLKTMSWKKTKKERLNDINFYYFEPKFSIKGIVANIISTKTNEEAFIFATPQKETNKITISARTQNDKRDLREILKAGVEGLEESNTGGHKRAVGGILKAEDIDKFKKNIRNFVEHKS